MRTSKDGIAVVGIACKFPGAKSKEEFWNNLIENKDTVHKFSDSELEQFEYSFDEIREMPNYVRARGCIDDIDKWDADFFKVVPKHAREMDPQQRIWLENTWHAFEDAGIDPFKYKGNIGVFAGSYLNTYLLNNILRDPEKYELYIRGRSHEVFQTYLNNDPMFLATRTAYFYNLRGPALSIQTGCSTSLVAITQACNSLLLHESDVCVSGGVNILVPQETGYFYSEGAIGSPDGHCRPFDKDSKGTVFGNGVGTVILKRLEDAIKDNDRIYSVIKGWAVNNDGKQKVGFTAPSIQGQSEVIHSAITHANVSPENICYVEAHGTATPLGDPIEFSSFSKVFQQSTLNKQFCGIGSVKSNIGHLDAASGVAGLIKIALSAYHKTIPATLHYKEPNAFLNIKNSPFYVLSKNLQWDGLQPMIMGVSSLGVGGTNAHIILEDYNSLPIKNNTDQPVILPFSAHKDNVLSNYQQSIISHLNENPDTYLLNLAYTLQLRRHHMDFRSFAILDHGTSANMILSSTIQQHERADLVFMYPGQGAQYLNMGKQLYEKEPFFKRIMDKCFSYYSDLTGSNLESIVFNNNETDETLKQTKYTQPAIFVIEYTLAKLLEYYGVHPKYSIGHSIGEYTAACLSGVFDLKTAISIVVKRGELMNDAQPGKMMAINCGITELEKINDEFFEIAAINSPSMTAISYQEKDEEDLMKALKNSDINFISLRTSHGFHSHTFDPILEEFKSYLGKFKLNKPKTPFISCLSGEFISDTQACSAEYWANQLRHTVLFSKGIETICENTNPVFLEVGPNTHLGHLVGQNEFVKNRKDIVATLGKKNEIGDQIKFYKSLGELWSRKIDVDFDKFHENAHSKPIDLPLYPFDKKRFWIDYVPSRIQNKEINKNSPIENYDSTTNNEHVLKEGKSSDIDLTQNSFEGINTERIRIKNISKSTKGIVSNSDLEEALLSIWKKHFGREDITLKDNFNDLGGESMLAFSLLADIEKTLQVKLSYRDFVADYNSVIKTLSFVKEKRNLKKEYKPQTDNFNHIYCLNSKGISNPIFSVFCDRIFSIKDSLKFGPVYDFVWPGSDGKPFKMGSVEEYAQAFMDEIQRVRPEGPYYLMGYSFGGLVAFEIALRLQQKGFEVPILLLIDCQNPQLKVSKSNRLKDLYKKKGYSKATSHILFSLIPELIRIKKEKINIYLSSKFRNKLSAKLTKAMIFYQAVVNSTKYNPGFFNGKIVTFKSKESLVEDEFFGWQPHSESIRKFSLEGNHSQAVRLLSNKKLIISELENNLENLNNNQTEVNK
jgi:acyl transferase domain-containing protein/thioesterase domain-containing protein/acyl carrier protein